MAIKTYNAGVRFNEDYYIMPIVRYNTNNPYLSELSIGVEIKNPSTGEKMKLQMRDAVKLSDFQEVDDFITVID